jgi:hypothetical protein
MLDLALLDHELRACSQDAGIDPASLVVFVVDAVRPPGTTPLAYLQPAASVRDDTVLVFRAVGRARVDPFRLGAHRLGIWGALPGVPDAALGPMLRHELEHARRFERSGPSFFDADERLRAAVSRAGGSGYARLPSEREANAAAADYAARTLSALERRAVADCELCAGLLRSEGPPGDVVGETLSELARLVGRGELRWDETFDAETLDAVRRDCAAWTAAQPPDLVAGRSGPRIELVTPISPW